MHLTSAALTHPGLRRDSNEDAFVERLGLGLFVVADGMGGHAAGEVASKVATDTIEAFIEHSDGAGDDITWPFGFDPASGIAGTRLRTAFRLANHAIASRMADDQSLLGMATTAVALLVDPGDTDEAGQRDARGTMNEAGQRDIANPQSPIPNPGGRAEAGTLSALVAHVGDSRAYLWREGRLEQITRDHSWVEEQIAMGEMTEDEARVHPWRNLVTRALSGGADPEVHLTPLALEPGDRVLLCSDGLCGPVRDDVIAGIVGRSPQGETVAICEGLIDAANAVGGPDNITVIVIEVGTGDRGPGIRS